MKRFYLNKNTYNYCLYCRFISDNIRYIYVRHNAIYWNSQGHEIFGRKHVVRFFNDRLPLIVTANLESFDDDKTTLRSRLIILLATAHRWRVTFNCSSKHIYYTVAILTFLRTRVPS